MRHKCIRIRDYDIHLAIQRLYPFVQVALFEKIMEMAESGQLSGIQSDVDEYVGVSVSVYDESIGYLSTRVYDVEEFFRYKK